MIKQEIQPPIYTPGKPDILTPEAHQLTNGIPLRIMNAGTQEVTRLDFLFDAGTWYEDKHLQAVMTNAMLQEGSQNYSGAQLAEIMDFRGAYIQFLADHHLGGISLIALNKHLPYLLPVVEDLIKNPLFEQAELDTLINRRKQRFLLENKKVKVLCQKRFSTALFGDNHPYAQRVKADDFNTIKREDLVEFYQRCYRSNHCRILATGKTDEKLPAMLEQHFGTADWAGEALLIRDRKIQPSSEKKHHVNQKDAIQSAIRIGRPSVQKDHPDYIGLQILNTILGGYFSSRLMANIREEKGYTYGIGSSIMNLKNAGYWVIATETANEYVDATVREVFLELKKLREEEVSEAELKRVRQYLLGEFIRDFDGPFAQAQSFRAVDDFGLDQQFYDAYYQTLLTIMPADLLDLANRYLNEEDFYTVVAGA